MTDPLDPASWTQEMRDDCVYAIPDPDPRTMEKLRLMHGHLGVILSRRELSVVMDHLVETEAKLEAATARIALLENELSSARALARPETRT
jgi:hypothetical protein